MKKNRVFTLLVIAMLGCCAVFPASAEEKKDLQSKLDDEFRWLREEAMVTTQIATKTDMDADMVPGMVTVLKGKDLEDQGFRTVGESLVLVPGIDLNSTMAGLTTAVIRGITSSTKIKILLNGIPVNSTMEGLGSAVFYIPVEQVERIEVIRGPGSGLYGEWAYLGVVNVKTYQEGNRVFGRAGSYDYHSGGLRASYQSEDKNLKTSLNIAGWERDKTDVVSGPDMLGRSGEVNNSVKSPTAIFSLDYKKFSLTGQWTENPQGNNFGLSGALPSADDKNEHLDRYKTIEARFSPDISKDLTSEIKFGWREYTWDSGDILWLFPAGVMTPTDSIAGSYYDERAYYGSLLFHWTGWQKQHWLTGLEYTNTRMGESWTKYNFDPISYEPVPFQKFTGIKNWLAEDKERKTFGFFIQDQIDISEKLAVTAGVRYDRYEDGEHTYSRITPRIAGVFRATDQHIFKVQYAESFRPPSFMEMYAQNNFEVIGNPNLDFETVKTYEAEYIYRSKQFVGKLTVFYSEMDNLIYTVSSLNFNVGGAKNKGAEAEVNWRPAESLTVNANLSYIDTEDEATGSDVKNSPTWLSNAALIWQPVTDWTAAFNYRHVGNRNRGPNDPRESLDGYDTLNLTLSRKNLFYKGLTLRSGVKNLFDADVRYPGNYTGYKEDYPQTGREWWVQLSYDF